jgi:hypothetical protein
MNDFSRKGAKEDVNFFFAPLRLCEVNYFELPMVGADAF